MTFTEISNFEPTPTILKNVNVHCTDRAAGYIKIDIYNINSSRFRERYTELMDASKKAKGYYLELKSKVGTLDEDDEARRVRLMKREWDECWEYYNKAQVAFKRWEQYKLTGK